MFVDIDHMNVHIDDFHTFRTSLEIERVQGQRDLVTKRESILIFLSTLFYK